MAKVSRAARVASRQRVETLTGDKQIGAAETGELYIVDVKDLTITLPPVQDGAYFKFVIGKELNTATTFITITTATANGGDNAKLHGSCFEVGTGVTTTSNHSAHNTNNTYKVTGTSHGSNHLLHQGSYFECTCDGTAWVCTAVNITKGDPVGAFSAV